MKSWIQAGRPLAHVNIAVPLLLGQVAAWHVTGRFSWPWFAAALLWGVLDHLFVIFANDFADHETDSGRRTLLSGGSGVIPEGKLTALQVGRAARTAAILLIVYSCALAFVGRVWTPLYGLAALLLMWLYSFAPVRLSYRGGGELLQGIGVGIGLPSLGYYMQAEGVLAPGWVIAPAALLGVCSNVLTALPDVEDDTTCAQEYMAGPARHPACTPFRICRDRLRRVRGVPLDALDLCAGQGGRGDRFAAASASRRSCGRPAPRGRVVEHRDQPPGRALDARDGSEALAARAERSSGVFAKLVEIPARVGLGIEAPGFDWHVPPLGEKPVEGKLVAGLARKRKWIARHSIG